MGSGQFANGVTFCVSAVAPATGRYDYGPKGLADANPQKAWCAPAGAQGAVAWIEIRIDDGSEFRRLLFQNGYGKSPQSYRNNSRPKTIEIRADDGPAARVVLPDFHDMAAVELPSVGKHRVVRLSIIDVYKGDKYGDVCLDYVMPDFEYEEALHQSLQPSNAPDAGSKDGAGAGVPPKPVGKKDPFGDLGLPADKDLELEPR